MWVAGVERYAQLKPVTLTHKGREGGQGEGSRGVLSWEMDGHRSCLHEAIYQPDLSVGTSHRGVTERQGVRKAWFGRARLAHCHVARYPYNPDAAHGSSRFTRTLTTLRYRLPAPLPG